MSAVTVAFIGCLVYQCRRLERLLEDHLNEHDGEVLPHLFMADLERWVEVEVAGQDDEPSTVIEKVLALLEEGALRDDEVAEVIHASFLEHLPRLGRPGADVRAMLGPALTERLRQIG